MSPTARVTIRILALPLLFSAMSPFAIPGQAHWRPGVDPTLGQQIAEQGNRALHQIRAEVRPELRLPDVAAR